MARIETKNCPNCGGALGIPDRHEQFFRCSYCGSVLEDRRHAEPKAPIQLTVATTHIDASRLAAYAAPAAGLGCGAVVAVIAVVVVGIAAAVFALRGAVGGGGGAGGGDGLDIYSFTAAAIVPSDDETGRDVVAAANAEDGPELYYLDLDADQLERWSVALELDDPTGTFDQFLTDAGLLYLSSGDQVVAFNRRSGAEAFTIRLADVIQHNICPGCFQLLGPARDTIVALSADGTLSAWDAKQGTERWSRRLEEATRQVIDVQGNPAVIDQPAEGEPVVRVYDATTGAVLHEARPNCADGVFSAMGIYDYLVPVGGGSFVWVRSLGTASCAQRWDPGQDAPAWSVAVPEGTTGPDGPEEVVVTGSAMHVVRGDRITSFDLATGAGTPIQLPDTDLLAVGERDGVLVVHATTTRGSRRTELRAVDLATGNVKWTFAPEAEPIEDSSRLFVTGDGYLAGFVPDGLSVVQYRQEAEELLFQVIPLQSGTASAPSTFDLAGSGFIVRPNFFGYDGDLLLMAATHQVRGVDTATAEVVLPE